MCRELFNSPASTAQSLRRQIDDRVPVRVGAQHVALLLEDLDNPLHRMSEVVGTDRDDRQTGPDRLQPAFIRRSCTLMRDLEHIGAQMGEVCLGVGLDVPGAWIAGARAP